MIDSQKQNATTNDTFITTELEQHKVLILMSFSMAGMAFIIAWILLLVIVYCSHGEKIKPKKRKITTSKTSGDISKETETPTPIQKTDNCPNKHTGTQNLGFTKDNTCRVLTKPTKEQIVLKYYFNKHVDQMTAANSTQSLPIMPSHSAPKSPERANTRNTVNQVSAEKDCTATRSGKKEKRTKQKKQKTKTHKEKSQNLKPRRKLSLLAVPKFRRNKARSRTIRSLSFPITNLNQARDLSYAMGKRVRRISQAVAMPSQNLLSRISSEFESFQGALQDMFDLTLSVDVFNSFGSESDNTSTTDTSRNNNRPMQQQLLCDLAEQDELLTYEEDQKEEELFIWELEEQLADSSDDDSDAEHEEIEMRGYGQFNAALTDISLIPEENDSK